MRGEARFADAVGIFPEFLDGYGMLVLPTTGRYFQVPYGILVPQEVDNLLVAGRCVAGDKVSHAATRSQMCCAVTGQAAGAAAAVSLKTAAPRPRSRSPPCGRSCGSRACALSRRRAPRETSRWRLCGRAPNPSGAAPAQAVQLLDASGSASYSSFVRRRTRSMDLMYRQA